ncbi:MAG: hypothetical protein DWP97_12020, partial [Calditrichaeota bacterium]
KIEVTRMSALQKESEQKPTPRGGLPKFCRGGSRTAPTVWIPDLVGGRRPRLPHKVAIGGKYAPLPKTPSLTRYSKIPILLG